MIHSLKGDRCRCLLIDWDNSFGPAVYAPSIKDHDTRGTSDDHEVAGTSDEACPDESTAGMVPLPVQDPIRDLANRTVRHIQSENLHHNLHHH
jgi:hypothetical protein